MHERTRGANLLLGNQRVRRARLHSTLRAVLAALHAPRPPHSMHVGVDVAGHVVVDHGVDIVDVQPSCRDVRRNKNIHQA
jgi:hypothetical protein